MGHVEDEDSTYVDESSPGEIRAIRIDCAFIDEKNRLSAWINSEAQGSDHRPFGSSD